MRIPVKLALSYHSAGLAVLPAIREQKRPAVGPWKKYINKSPNKFEVEAWFLNGHDAVCIIGGKVSGNLECIDFDSKAEAFPEWARRVDKSTLMRLVIENTPSGGKHVVYRVDGEVEGNQKLAQGVRNGKYTTLIETRGEGGIFLCAPSPGYVLEQGEFEHLPVISKAERNSLLEAARSLNEQVPVTPVKTPQSAAVGAFKSRPGDDFADRGDMRPILIKYGWTSIGTQSDGNEFWVRPRKDPRAGHSATLKGRVFYPFSSNAAPFEPGKGYNAFQVYTLLEHNGDFAAAAAKLLSEGYGAKEDVSDVDLTAILEEHSEETTGTKKEPRFKNPGPIPEEYFNVPGFVNEYQEFLARTAPYPNKTIAFVSAFGLLAHLAGRKYRDVYNTRTNLYFITVASSGGGKQHSRSMNVNVATMIGIANQIGDSFASAEGLEDSVCMSPSMLYQVDEFDHLFNIIKLRDQRAELISAMLLKFFSESNTTHVMRKKAQQPRNMFAMSPTIIWPNLTVIGSATPKGFYESLSERSMENGLFARCIVFEAGKRSRMNKLRSVEDIPERIIEDAKKMCQMANEVFQGPYPTLKIVPMNDEAAAALSVVQDECDDKYSFYEDRGDEASQSIWARAIEKINKFALVYAISANIDEPVITKEAVEWARKIIFHATERSLWMADRFVYNNDFDQLMKRLLDKIEKVGGGKLTYRDALRHMSISSQDLKTLAQTLAERDDIKITKGPKGGDVYELKR